MTEAIRVGLYGCGQQTRSLVESVAEEGVIRVTACYDVNRQTAERIASEYEAQSVASPTELLERRDVDAFIISLPPACHAAAAVAAAETGKAIYLEKPMAVTLEEGKMVVEAVERNGVTCHVGFAHRHVEVLARVTEILRSGRLGRIIGLHNHWLGGLLPVHYYASGNWRSDPASGGELLYHNCHHFDLLRVWCGEAESLIATSNKLIQHDCPHENEIYTAITFKSGGIAGGHFSTVSARNGSFGRIEGSEGTLEYEWSLDSIINFYEGRRGLLLPTSQERGFDCGNFNRKSMRNFIGAIREEQPVEITVRDGMAILDIIFAVRESAATGRRVALAPVAEAV